MADAPTYAESHPAKHGFGEGVKSAFHEVPAWGWWVGGALALFLFYIHHKAQSQTSMAGPSTTAADVTAGGTSVDAGDVVGLNNLLVQSEVQNQQAFQALEAQIAALQASVTKTGTPVIPTYVVGEPTSPGHVGTTTPGPVLFPGSSTPQYNVTSTVFTHGPGTIDESGGFTPASGIGGTFQNKIHPIPKSH